MANRTASDMRAHLASFEPECPIKKGYIIRLLINDKLPISDICRRIMEIVQIAEPDRLVHKQRTTSAIYNLKNTANKKINYAVQRQWDNFVTVSQEPFGISFHDTARSIDSSAVTSTALIQPEHTNAQFIQPEHTNAQFIQPEHTSASMPLQHTSETSVVAVVGLTSESIYNVLSRSPSPKRLKRDCDNCVAKQRTNLNMLTENKSLREQIRTLKQQLGEERKQLSLKILNEKIRRQSQSATLWRSKYTTLRRQFKDMEKVEGLIHKAQKQLLKKVSEEEHKKLTCRTEYLQHVLAETEMKSACLKTESHKIRERFSSEVQKMKARLREERQESVYWENQAAILEESVQEDPNVITEKAAPKPPCSNRKSLGV